MMYIRYPLSLRQVEDLLFERGIDICHETVRFWWNRFGPMFAAEIRKRRVHHRSFSQWQWHLDEVCVRINAVMSAVGYNLRHSSDLRGPTGATVPPQSQVVEETLAQNHRRDMGRDNPAISAQTRFLTAD